MVDLLVVKTSWLPNIGCTGRSESQFIIIIGLSSLDYTFRSIVSLVICNAAMRMLRYPINLKNSGILLRGLYHCSSAVGLSVMVQSHQVGVLYIPPERVVMCVGGGYRGSAVLGFDGDRTMSGWQQLIKNGLSV